MSDIVVTWPKTKPLEDYLHALHQAWQNVEHINFRVPALPDPKPQRCYRVHDGAVRGWTPVAYVAYRGAREIRDAVTGGWWPAGKYIVCEPFWNPIDPVIPMRGFQGWRWFERIGT